MTAPQKRNPAGGPGFEKVQTNGLGLHANDTALHRLRGLLPTLAVECRIALEAARDIHYLGGLESSIELNRLALAAKRCKRIAEVVSEAEREVHQ